MLAFQGAELPESLVVHGHLGEQPWSSQVSLNGGQQGASLAPEWGRRKIAELMIRLHDAENNDARQALHHEIVATGLAHHLVSQYTSLVAVDITPARDENEQLYRHALKTNLPHGWSYEHVFGLPQTATAAQLHLLIGSLLILLASVAGLWSRRQPC